MGRPSKPFYWKARKAWYCTIEGKRHCLGEDKKLAHKRFHELMAQGEKSLPVNGDSVAALLDDFLAWTKQKRSEGTYEWYRIYCQSFTDEYGLTPVADLGPEHVSAWLSGKTTWNPTTERGAVTALMRAFNWAVKNRGLAKNPLAGMERPEAETRANVVSAEEFQAILEAVKDDAFQELLIVSYDCGARPQEVKRLEARHIDLEKRRAVLPTSEAKGRRRARVIYFPTEQAMEIIKRRMEEHPTGPILRNRNGRPWTASAVKCRFSRLEEKVGKRYRQYDFRHTWITRKLLAGVDSHVVATLAGHANTTMIHQIYSHVADDHQFMLEQAKKNIS